ncbi:MAG: PKD domain-containing protein [bacterium]
MRVLAALIGILLLVGACSAATMCDFTANVTSGTAPLAVGFDPTNTTPVTSWNWSFGDGSYSSDEDASHRYTTPGWYSVQLTVANASASDIELKKAYIHVADIGRAHVPLLAYIATLFIAAGFVVYGFWDTQNRVYLNIVALGIAATLFAATGIMTVYGSVGVSETVVESTITDGATVSYVYATHWTEFASLPVGWGLIVLAVALGIVCALLVAEIWYAPPEPSEADEV